MDSGYAALFGALIGGVFTLIGTSISQWFNIKSEKKLFQLNYLKEKRMIIESILNERSGIFYIGNNDHDATTLQKDYDIIKKFMNLHSHHFIDNTGLQGLISHIAKVRVYCEVAVEGDDLNEDFRSVVDLFVPLVTKELNDTMAELKRIMR